MATYIELRNLMNDSPLRNRVVTATIIGAQGVMGDPANFPTPTVEPILQADRQLWAARAFNNPGAEGTKILMSVLAANASATVPQITGATDVQIQANADAAIDLFAVNDKPVVV